ncbi:MAG: nucleotide exchange factor GrpE [Gemmatimonadetes bacterium]|nr:nucleotide exchange factor GrpE [Gemmatimonadota bacterium]
MTERPFEEDLPLADAEVAEVAGAAPPAEPAESAVHRLTEQLAEANDRYLRLAADFDNFRRRVAKERIELADRAQAAFVIRLLDVLDDLDRLAATDPASPVATLRQAVEMVDRKLRKELEQAGLERLDPVGQKFDPAVAEAVSVVPPPAADQDHSVSATFQVGYRFKGALVRPARVQVYSSEGHA